MHASAGAFVGSAGYTKDPVRTIGGGNNTYLYIELPKQDYMHRYSDIEIKEHINDLFKLRIINMKIESTGIIRVLYQKM